MSTLTVFPLAAIVLFAPPSQLKLAQVPETTISAQSYPVHTFEERWEPVRRLPPTVDLSSKTERLEPRLWAPRMTPEMFSPELPTRLYAPKSGMNVPVNVVRIIPITRESEAQAQREAAAEPEKEPEPRGDIQQAVPSPVPAPRPHVKKTRTVSLGLCERHGMRKVATNGGKSWRCKR